MKVLFIITSIKSGSQGQGGHYHSLLLTREELSKRCETVVVNIGTQGAEALKNRSGSFYTFESGLGGLFEIYGKLMALVKAEKPDIVHAFDRFAYFWARLIGIRYKLPCCLTKCGGENPKLFWPYSPYLIVYSSENRQYFLTKRKFASTDIRLIPNRVRKVSSDVQRINELKQELFCGKKYSLIVLRVGRIGPYYKKSILQTLNLVQRLRQDGIDCCAVILGTMEDQGTWDELSQGKEHYYVVTDSYYTRNAKELIDIGDFVVGTGRSYMEAASSGKVMLCPSIQGTMPTLVDEYIFEQAFYYNFSERLAMNNYNEDANYTKILSLANNKTSRAIAGAHSLQIFSEHFEADNLIDRHWDLYGSMLPSERISFDLIVHMLFLIRKYLV